jgi:hypothetical protein
MPTPKKPGKDAPKYPTLVEIEAARDWEIRHWYNTLPSPDMKDESQIDAMNLIIKRNRAIKKQEAQTTNA